MSKSCFFHVLLGVLYLTPLSSTRVVSSYCSNNNCNASIMTRDSDAINGFSTTSYHLDSSGLISPCTETSSGCGWSGSVQEFNQDAQTVARGALVAIPLVFNNAGNMVENFRVMVSMNLQDQVINYLVSQALSYDYKVVSLDLEPSCWQSNSSLCQFPGPMDVSAFHSFLDDLSEAMHTHGRKLSVAAGSYPVSQCDGGFQQYAMCGQNYSSLCESGLLDVSTCNCCGFTTWFEPTGLCRTKVDLIVNMDTYMDSPFNSSYFDEAIAWYLDNGCTMTQLGIGLLATEAQTSEEVELMFNTIQKYDTPELDIWVNFWTNDTRFELWREHLATFANT